MRDVAWLVRALGQPKASRGGRGCPSWGKDKAPCGETRYPSTAPQLRALQAGLTGAVFTRLLGFPQQNFLLMAPSHLTGNQETWGQLL